MTKWVVGETYLGSELHGAPAGTIVKNRRENVCCKLPDEKWGEERWEGGFNSQQMYKLLALPFDGEIIEGEFYPACRLYNLPDGTVLGDFHLGNTQKILKYEGEWLGSSALCIHPSSYFPLCVLKLPTLVGKLFTGEQLREHIVTGLVVEDDDGEIVVFDGASWVGDGHVPTAQPGRFFRVVSVPD